MYSWESYDANAQFYFESYIHLSFEEIFSDVMEYFPLKACRCLDIGAGSGRDAAALAKKGYAVTAVEPSDGMRNLAIKFHEGLPIEWVKDSLPLLSSLASVKDSFDLILMSAVWMHLDEHDRLKSLHTVSKLLCKNGVFILTLRLGNAEPKRNIFKISLDEAIDKAVRNGFIVKYINPVKGDSLNRSSVKWQIVVFSK
ncbi:class I SAM-dependent methyltransferase [Pantoea agglomerans]|uniref:class I SAM-dependent methyltransferase n=1 Tax=Enterobacter agglomerans TaxID=549 RepID=UPI00165456BF|nr:class I SAM-dependent methyltransferase [Pantoea agglomerans]